MKSNKEILIQDACILIDLIEVGLIEECFQLGYEFITTRNVVFEIEDDYQSRILTQVIGDHKLFVRATSDSQVNGLQSQFSGLSLADCSVMSLGISLKCRVLTADGALRKICQEKGVRVGGFLWVLNQLVKSNTISPNRGITALDKYSMVNQRPAPKHAVQGLRKEFVILADETNNTKI